MSQRAFCSERKRNTNVIIMISVVWLFKKYQFFAQRLILYLSIATLLDSVAYMLGGLYQDGPVCDFQAFWLTYWEWSQLLWVCAITFNLFMSAVWMWRVEQWEIWYHVACWGLPLLLACLPFIGDRYGPAGAWCWIQQQYTDWRFAIWYGPLFTIIFLLIVTYACLTVHIRRKLACFEGTYSPQLERHKQVIREDVKPLLGYPFVYLTLNIFPLVNRIQNAVTHDAIFALVLLHSVCSPLPGAIYAIVFGMDRETRARLTWVQIKTAFLAHCQQDVMIHEYPTVACSWPSRADDDSVVADTGPEDGRRTVATVADSSTGASDVETDADILDTSKSPRSAELRFYGTVSQ